MVKLGVIFTLVVLTATKAIYADGVDDPNFYKDFNPEHPSKKYEFFAPPEWKQGQSYNVQPIPYTDYWHRPHNIPEPSELVLLSVGAAAMCAWRRYK